MGIIMVAKSRSTLPVMGAAMPASIVFILESMSCMYFVSAGFICIGMSAEAAVARRRLTSQVSFMKPA
jgi:hypothetical protein